MLVDIIEGDFPKQAAVLTPNYLGKPGLFLGLKDAHKVMRCYYVRSAVDGLDTIIDDPKKPTIKILLRDGNVVIAKVSLNDLNSIKIAMALGPDDSIPVVNFLPDKKNPQSVKAEGGIQDFYAKQKRRRNMWIIIGVFGLLYVLMFSSDNDPTHGGLVTPPPAARPASLPVKNNVPSDYMGPILDRVKSYEAFLDGAKDEFKTLDPKNIDMDKIRSTLVLMESMAEALEAAHLNNAAWAEADRAYLNKMADKTAQFQNRVLPKLRKAYQYTAGSIMWEHDVSVTVGGDGNRTVTYTGVVFASNQGIKQVQQSLQDVQARLRFKQSRFRWMEEGDITTYNLKPPSDSALMTFKAGVLTPARIKD